MNKRDLCRCSCVCKRWNTLTYTKELWGDFSLTDIVRPKWSASKLLSIENSNYLIEKRFGSNIIRVDLAKLCFSFETLDTLFQNCTQIESLCINFKYLQIRSSCKYLVQQLDVYKWPVNRLKKLYLKNVCDMKIRRYCGYGRNNPSGQPPTSYDMIELQIIQLICTLFKRNSSSLKYLWRRMIKISKGFCLVIGLFSYYFTILGCSVLNVLTQMWSVPVLRTLRTWKFYYWTI